MKIKYKMTPKKNKINSNCEIVMCEKQDHSNWMKELCQNIRDHRPITDLSIPGSHDSITYSLKKYDSGWLWFSPNFLISFRSGSAGPDQPQWIRRLTRLFPGISSHILYRWSVTQSLSVTQQLDRGIRLGFHNDLPLTNVIFKVFWPPPSCNKTSSWLNSRV